MNKSEIIRLIIAMCLGYGVLFAAMLLFRTKKKDDKIKEEETMKDKITIKINRLNSEAILPSYAHDGDAGLDLYSLEDIEIPGNSRVMISTGIAIELPKEYVALVWDKSGLAYKHGLKVLGGVCDSNYTGEYKVILLNTSKESYKVNKGNKIAQILIQPVESVIIQEVNELTNTTRGEGGFGSTGLT